MSIALVKIWETKLYEYNAQASSVRFKHDFIRACNNALDRYSIKTNLTTKISHVDQVDETIDMDEDHGFVLEAGIDRYLIQYGHQSGDQDLATVKSEFEDVLGDALLDRDQESASDADDGEVIAMFDDE